MPIVELNKIYEADCIGFMKEMEDKSVDLVFADPPYNAKDIGPKHRKYSAGQMQLPKKKYEKFTRDWIRESIRIGKCVAVTPGIANVYIYPESKWIICWHKPAAVSFNRMGGFNAWEPILIYGDMPKGNKVPQDYWLVNTLNFSKGPEKDHPCPKPLKLIRKIVLAFSHEGDTIFDPFMGSGTTAVAGIKENRNFIGTEKNPEYIKICHRRIQTINEMQEIF
jgi:site-specific DNA-methyltransferase (adenine-specific)